MHNDGTQGETAASQRAPGCPISDRSRISRRQALGRISAVAGTGAVAWVVPEIFTAKAAAGATLSGGPATAPASPAPGGTTGGGVSTAAPTQPSGPTTGVSTAAPTQPSGPTSGVSTAAATQPSGPTSGVSTAASTQPSGPLAYSGLNIERDAEIGAALIAGGWAMHHWASRTQEERPTA